MPPNFLSDNDAANIDANGGSVPSFISDDDLDKISNPPLDSINSAADIAPVGVQALKNAPSGFASMIGSIPSGLKNLWDLPDNLVGEAGDIGDIARYKLFGTVSDNLKNGTPQADYGQLDRTLGGAGNIVSAGIGGTLGAVAGAVVPGSSLATGAIGASEGQLGFQKIQQILGLSSPTTAGQDLASLETGSIQNALAGKVAESAFGTPASIVKTGGSAIDAVADSVGPQTPEAAAQVVADSLEKLGINKTDVDSAVANLGNDPLGHTKTSAQALNSPALATIEQIMGSGDRSAEYNQSRADAADQQTGILQSLSSGSPGISDETVGGHVQDAIEEARAAEKAKVSALYSAIPEGVTPDITGLNKVISNASTKYFGDGAPSIPGDIQGRINFLRNSGAQTLTETSPILDELGRPVTTISEIPSTANIQSLQKARSHLNDIARTYRRSGSNESAALAESISSGISDTIKNAPNAGPEWQAANQAYSEYAQKYLEGPLSKVADALPSKIIDKITASPEAAAQAASFLQDKPNAIAAIQSKIASDLTDMSEVKRANYINNNESQLKTIFGSKFDSLDAVRSDIENRIATQASANRTRGSNTALKLSGTVDKVLGGKDVSAPSLLQKIATTLGFGAAISHPLTATGLVVGSHIFSKLKGASASLVEDALYKAVMDPRELQKLPFGSAEKAQTGAALAQSLNSLKPAARTLALATRGSNPRSLLQKVLNVNDEPDAQTAQTIAAIKADPTAHAIAMTESSMNPKATNPDSTAKGLFQFLDSTGKTLGITDPFDVNQQYSAYKANTASNTKILGTSDPETLYAAHVVGPGVVKKVIDGEGLTLKETANWNYFLQKALPNFQKNYAEVNGNA